MKLSYIVSCHNDPQNLACLLWSLMLQTNKDYEIIVADNSESIFNSEIMQDICKDVPAMYSHIMGFESPDVRYLYTKMPSCYASADIGAAKASGDYLCFPSSDGYHMPTFGNTMLTATKNGSIDLVYCNIVYDSRCGLGRYGVCDVKPIICGIDKTQFIIRRSLFPGFVFDGVDEGTCDGKMIEEVIRQGASHVKLDDVLAVHN